MLNHKPVLRIDRYNMETRLPTAKVRMKMVAKRLSLRLTMTTTMIGGTPQIPSYNVCHVPPPYNLVKSARAKMIPTVRLKGL